MSREKGCTCIVSFAAILTPRKAKSGLSLEHGSLHYHTYNDVLAKDEASIMHREAIEHEHACHVVKV